MISARFAFLSLLASSAVASAGLVAREELTTTSTEIVYVTVTQTLPISEGDSYTVMVTPTLVPDTTTTTTTTTTSCTTTSTTEEAVSTVESYTTEVAETYTVHIPSNTTSLATTTLAPSGGFTTTIKSNETTYSTSGPSAPSTTDEEGGAPGLNAGPMVALMGFIGAVVLMF